MKYNPGDELPFEITRRFYIDGAWQSPLSTETATLISPVDESVVIEMPMGGPADMDAAIGAARRAFDLGPWPRMTPHERADMIERLGQAIAADTETLVHSWTGQVGAPISLARILLPMAPDLYRYYADLARSFAWSDNRSTMHGGAKVVREPVGVCALVTPWNNPLTILSGKLAAALAAGCTVVIKPPPQTPIEALMIAKYADQIGFPPGVINVVTGDREVGAYLTAHPDIDKVSFTGSTRAGKAIGAACAQNMTRVSLELGGKSAGIVTKDASLDVALRALVPWSMPFSGQACLALTRILVHRSREQELIAAYSGAIGAMMVGDPWDEQTRFGPLAYEAQMHRVLGYLEKGAQEGAEAVIGGGRDERFNGGYFIQPTVFADVTPQMAIAREEIFGPVVCVIPFDDEDEAVAIANDTPYGLHGAVFSTDAARAEAVALRVRTGSIGINTFDLDVAVPFGGYKFSGMGREGGPEGLSAFLESKTLYLGHAAT